MMTFFERPFELVGVLQNMGFNVAIRDVDLGTACKLVFWTAPVEVNELQTVLDRAAVLAAKDNGLNAGHVRRSIMDALAAMRGDVVQITQGKPNAVQCPDCDAWCKVTIIERENDNVVKAGCACGWRLVDDDEHPRALIDKMVRCCGAGCDEELPAHAMNKLDGRFFCDMCAKEQP